MFPPKKERREQRFSIAEATIIIVVLMGLIMGFCFHKISALQQKRQKLEQERAITRAVMLGLVEDYCTSKRKEILKNIKENDGEFMEDPWGSRIKARIVEHNFTNEFRLRSPGPDKIPYTNDDLIESSQDWTPQRAAVKTATAMGTITKTTTKSWVRGAWEGVFGSKDKESK